MRNNLASNSAYNREINSHFMIGFNKSSSISILGVGDFSSTLDWSPNFGSPNQQLTKRETCFLTSPIVNLGVLSLFAPLPFFLFSFIVLSKPLEIALKAAS